MKKKQKDLITVILIWLLATCLMFCGCHPPEHYCPANNWNGYLFKYNHYNHAGY